MKIWGEKFAELKSAIKGTAVTESSELDKIIENNISEIVSEITALRNVEAEFKAIHQISLDIRMIGREKYEESVELYEKGEIDCTEFMDNVINVGVAFDSIVLGIAEKYEQKQYEMVIACTIMDNSLEILNDAMLLVYKKDKEKITDEVLCRAKELFDGHEELIRYYQEGYVAVSVLNSRMCCLASTVYGSYDCPEIEAAVKHLKKLPQLAANDRFENLTKVVNSKIAKSWLLRKIYKKTFDKIVMKNL